ncbi:hypothetical protein [Sulfurimonas sp.]|jgi:hypothetical protein|uniref:hypothetical protein n=1 Tax=Sulfurimonas sp. TaxID=2022749 RepID=UPI0025EF5CC8|nr:hypothetical protein [Sulfurimonas sp.]
MGISWEEYKEYKNSSVYSDNFEILLDFMKSYYGIRSVNQMFTVLNEDDTAKMMLSKREIKSAVDLEEYL